MPAGLVGKAGRKFTRKKLAAMKRRAEIPGCKCSLNSKRGERCTKSGWIHCNSRMAWLDREAKRHGLSGWRDMNARTNKPYRAALKALKG